MFLEVPPTAPTLAKVRYTHEACVDLILARPSVSQGELAQQFGYTEAWMSIIVNSDAFKTRLAERKGELVDPAITASMEDRMNGLARKSMEVLMEKLETKDAKVALESLRIVAPMVGPQRAAATSSTNLYIVQAPPRARTNEVWSGQVLEMQQGEAP